VHSSLSNLGQSPLTTPSAFVWLGVTSAFDPAFQRGRRAKANNRFPVSWPDLPVREVVWFAWHSVRTASLVQPAQSEPCLEVIGIGVEPQDAAAAQGVAKILGGMDELGCPEDFDAFVS